MIKGSKLQLLILPKRFWILMKLNLKFIKLRGLEKNLWRKWKSEKVQKPVIGIENQWSLFMNGSFTFLAQ